MVPKCHLHLTSTRNVVRKEALTPACKGFREWGQQVAPQPPTPQKMGDESPEARTPRGLALGDVQGAAGGH